MGIHHTEHMDEATIHIIHRSLSLSCTYSLCIHTAANTCPLVSVWYVYDGLWL